MEGLSFLSGLFRGRVLELDLELGSEWGCFLLLFDFPVSKSRLTLEAVTSGLNGEYVELNESSDLVIPRLSLRNLYIFSR